MSKPPVTGEQIASALEAIEDAKSALAEAERDAAKLRAYLARARREFRELAWRRGQEERAADASRGDEAKA